MKMLIIGCGGIGSFFSSELSKCIESIIIDPSTIVHISDNDIVELQQINYQNFNAEDIGLNKAVCLAKKSSVLVPIKNRINEKNNLPIMMLLSSA